MSEQPQHEDALELEEVDPSSTSDDAVDGGDDPPLFTSGDADTYRRRWESLQAGFVDRPQQMVEQADDLVGDLMQQLTTAFGERRTDLEEQWDRGENVSTEELRVAFTHYRSFFNRLLSA